MIQEMEEKKQFIEISVSLQRKIAGEFKVTPRTVRSAMSFETNSPSARLLRAYALENGGTLFEEKKTLNSNR